MATNTITNDLTIVEMMKRKFNGNIINVVMALAQRNELLQDAPLVEANDEFSNVSNRYVSVPKPTPRSINNGASKGHAEVEQIREGVMLLEQHIEIDEQILRHSPNKDAARMIEFAGRLEGLSQQLAYYLIYGNPGTDPRECMGLATRRSSLGTNCVSLGGSGSDMTSVYVIEWDPMWMRLIHPRGAGSYGVTFVDNGRQRLTGANSGPYYAEAYQVIVELGTSLVDERALQRIANIEASNATNNFIDSTKVRELVRAVNRLPAAGQSGSTYLYGNRSTKSQFDIYALEKSNGFYTMDNITGAPISVYRGLPIRMVEQIIDTEKAIS